MASAVVTIQNDELSALCSRLNAAALSDKDRNQLLTDIGVELETQVQERFHTKMSPDGDKWKDLADSTALYYQKKFGSKNPFNGLLWRNSSVPLRDTIMSETEGLSVIVGATKIYAAVHQWGYKKIPPRPYLGLGTGDKTEIMGIIERFLSARI